MEEFVFKALPESQTARQNVAEFSFTPKEEPDFSKLKANEIYSINTDNTNGAQKFDAYINSWIKKHPTLRSANEIAKSYTRSSIEMGKGLGTMLKVAGDNLNAYGTLDEETLAKSANNISGQLSSKFLRSAGEGLSKVGDLVHKYGDVLLNDETLKMDEEIFAGDFMENPSWTRAAAAVGSALPSLASMGVMAKTMGTTAAYFVMSGIDSADVYEKAKEKGKSQKEADIYYGASVAGTALIDKMLNPLEKIMGESPNGLGKKLAKKIIDGGLEGAAEGGQTVWQNFVTKYGIDNTQKLMEGFIESVIGGFGSGALASGNFSEVVSELKQKGATDNEINTIVDSAGLMALKNKDDLNNTAMQHFNAQITELDKFIELNAGTPEAREALRTKADLEQVGQEAYDVLIKAGRPEAEAKAAGKIMQGYALFGSQETGLTPLEYMRRYSPVIRKEEFVKFQEQFNKGREVMDIQDINPFEVLANRKMYNRLEKMANKVRGDSLLAFIKKRGGLKDVGGDLKAMDAGRQYIGLINNTNGNSIDDMALAAWEDGYFPTYGDRPTVNELLGAIEDELMGVKRYQYREGVRDDIVSVLENVDALAEQLNREGIDYTKMSTDEIEKAYNDLSVKYAEREAIKNEGQINTLERSQALDEWADIPFQFAGEKAQTAALDELDVAKEMEAEGADAEKIRQDTGWFKGVDGKWRFEIPDGKIKTDFDIEKHRGYDDEYSYIITPLEDIYDNEKLYEAYPELRSMPVQFSDSLGAGVLGSSFGGSISLSSDFLKIDNPEYIAEQKKLENTPEYKEYEAAYDSRPENMDYIAWNKKVDEATEKFFNTEVGKEYHRLMWSRDYEIKRKIAGLSEKAKSTLIHEIQHEIQKIEGFAKGGNSESTQSVIKALKVMADASEERERIEFFEKKLGDKEKAKNLIHQEWLATKALRESLEKTGDFSEEAMSLNDKYLNLVKEYGITEEDMRESYNTPSKRKYDEANAASSYDIYNRMAGEIEARNTQARMDMTDEERAATSPESTQDIANADAIVVFPDGTAMAYGDNYNPDKVRIEKGVVNITDAFNKIPTIQEVEETVARIVKIGGEFYTKTPNKKIKLPKGKYREGHLAHANGWESMSSEEKQRHNMYIEAYKELIENSVYSGSKPNTDRTNKNKRKVKNYHYFKVKVKIGKKIYDVVLDTEEFDNAKNTKPQVTSLYNVKEVSPSEKQSTKAMFENNEETSYTNNITPFGNNVKQKEYNPRDVIPNVRGGWNKAKILRYLKEWGSLKGIGNATRKIAEFNSVEDFKNHMFYHGARYGTSGSMKPSITMSDREVERIGGGGYGEKYWAISLSKSKKIAGNFATAMGSGYIYPVLLVKNANVIEMPELSDSADLEDHIVDLYNQGVDAVWIGDKNSGEQELAVINPRAIVNLGTSDFYRAYKLGQLENPINIKSDEDIQRIYDFAKDFVQEFPKTAPNEKLQEARDIVYWQSAFHGTPHPELEGGHFSIDKVGSGEGNAAHGWGAVYASLTFDTADGYRKRLLRRERDTVFPDSPEELAINTYLKNNKNREATIKELQQIEKDEYKKLNTRAENVLAYSNAASAVDYMRYIEDSTLEKQVIEIENGRGQTYELDIPENPYLLDEQKPFSEQSDIVKKGIIDTLNSMNLTEKQKEKFRNNIENRRDTGKEIYEELVVAMGTSRGDGLISSSKENMPLVSKALSESGVKGITYFGRQDGRCFVIFNPEDVRVIQKFYQDSMGGQKGNPKGAYTNADNVIHLFENADVSTFMHETAHWFKEELRRFGTARSKAMLNKVEEWANAEFDKRYKVELKDGYYVIKNTRGDVVYDKGFGTEDQARQYGKEELFARGFEQYLRTGKAPNNYLKSAFKSFWNWLRTLYRSAKQLDVDINDEIESVYATILGGEDLDFYLYEKPETVLEKKFEENEERNQEIDDIIEKSQAIATKPKMFENFVNERTESKKGLSEWLNKAIVPISTRAVRVSQGLKNRLRAYDYAVPQKYNQYVAQVKPFLEKWSKFEQDDLVALDLALKNDYVAKQLEILKKYDALEDFEKIRDLLDYLYAEAQSVGVKVEYRENYFPREVADVEGLLSYLHGPQYISELRRAKREAHYDDMLPEEQVDFMNKFLRGYERKDLVKSAPGNVKDRRIDIVSTEMNTYYKDSMQALMNYIDRMNNTIESRRFWGKDAETIEDSIGAFVDELIENGEIKPEQDKEVEEILRARFKARGVTNKFWQYQKNMSYIYTMGGINSAITQIDDISVALYKAGLWNTVTSILEPKHKGLSREELGLTRIGEEFREAASTSKAVGEVFKMTGLDKIDAFGKNVLINATFKKFQKMAQNDEAELRERIEPIMEQETNATIEAIKNGEITDNVQLLLFNELADMQPISLSEMPEYYLTIGNGRVFYMLKTFTLKRIDIFRNECFDKIKRGEVKTGVQNLFKLSMLMLLCGMGKDAIIDLLFGRRVDLSEMVQNNILGLVGLSKYLLYKTREEGPVGFASSSIPPVFAVWGDLINDLYKTMFSKKGKDIKDWDVWKGVPIVGRFYYWWFGGGYAKEQKKKKKLK